FKSFMWDRFYAFQYNPFKSLTFDFTATNNARIDEPPGKIDTREKRDSVRNNVLRFGRTTLYTHNMNVNYTLPINKLPILDWVQIRAGYSAGYTWIAAPLFADADGVIVANPLGNTLNNNQNQQLNGEFNFKNLYNKVRFLKQYNNTSRSTRTKEQREKQLESNQKRMDKIAK